MILRVDAVGICGTDLHIWRGGSEGVLPGTVLGHEFGGTVVDVGRMVEGWQPGDVVSVNPNQACGTCSLCDRGASSLCADRQALGIHLDGGLQRFISIDPAHALRITHGQPPGTPALTEPLAVGLHAVRRARVAPTDRVGIIGAGPVGLACAWAALREGVSSVTVVDPEAGRRSAAGKIGAAAIEPGSESDRGWDITIDAVGAQATFDAALASTRINGTVCVVGLAADAWSLASKDLMYAERTIVASFCYTDADLRETAAALRSGTVPDMSLHLVAGLESVPAAFSSLSTGNYPPGKTVVIP